MICDGIVVCLRPIGNRPAGWQPAPLNSRALFYKYHLTTTPCSFSDIIKEPVRLNMIQSTHPPQRRSNMFVVIVTQAQSSPYIRSMHLPATAPRVRGDNSSATRPIYRPFSVDWIHRATCNITDQLTSVSKWPRHITTVAGNEPPVSPRCRAATSAMIRRRLA